MFMDALLMLSDAQALTGLTAIVSTNTIDMGNPTIKRDVGIGEGLTLSVAVDVAMAGTTPTLTVEIIQSANADLSAPDVLASTGAMAGATLTAGKIVELPMPGGRISKRYLGARYTQIGNADNTVTVSAGVLPRSMSSQAVPRNYSKGYSN